MDRGLAAYAAFIEVVRQALFWLALALAVVALLDWLVRTRRVPPFGAVARFCRRWIDPLMAPVERQILRRGGLPTTAPWWALGAVIVGGLLLIALLELLGGLVAQAAWAASSPGRFGVTLLSWGFSILRIAIFVRVIASWFGVSPWSRWIRWAYVLTEWMLAPLRRVIPNFGPMDVSPLVALLLLWLIQNVLGIP
jgi:YggT family protein